MRALRHQRSAKIKQMLSLVETDFHLQGKALDMVIITGVTMVMASMVITIVIMMAMDTVKTSKMLASKCMSKMVVYFKGKII